MARFIITSVCFCAIGFYLGYSYLYTKYRDQMFHSQIVSVGEMVLISGTYLEGLNIKKQLKCALINSKETVDIMKSSGELNKINASKLERIEPLMNDYLVRLGAHNNSVESDAGNAASPCGSF